MTREVPLIHPGIILAEISRIQRFEPAAAGLSR
jgi:hypothetical protein